MNYMGLNGPFLQHTKKEAENCCFTVAACFVVEFLPPGESPFNLNFVNVGLLVFWIHLAGVLKLKKITVWLLCFDRHTCTRKHTNIEQIGLKGGVISIWSYEMHTSMIILETYTNVFFRTQQWMQLQWMHIVWTEVEAGQSSYCRMPWSSNCAAMEISMCWAKEALDANPLQLCHRTSQQLELNTLALAGLFHSQSAAV